MNTKMVVLLGGVGALHLAVAGLLLSGGCSPEDPPMPPGIYVPKQNPNQNPAYQDPGTNPAAEPAPAYPETTVQSQEPQAVPAQEPAGAKAKPAPAPAQAKDKRYVVVKGDSLWKIAHKNGLKIEELASYNSLKADARLKIGQVIYIPAAGTKGVKAKPAKKDGAKAAAKKDGSKASAKKDGAKGKAAKKAGKPAKSIPADGIHVVKSGENFTTIARQYGLKLSDVIQANPGVESNRLKVGQKIRLNESAAPAEIRKAPAKKAAPKAAAKSAPAAEQPAASAEEPAATAPADTPAPDAGAEQPPSKATKNEMDDLLKQDNPSAGQEADPKALVPDKDQTIINKDGDAEIIINSDTTVLAFCRKFRVQEAEVRRMNPALAGTNRIKAGSRILLSGGDDF